MLLCGIQLLAANYHYQKETHYSTLPPSLYPRPPQNLETLTWGITSSSSDAIRSWHWRNEVLIFTMLTCDLNTWPLPPPGDSEEPGDPRPLLSHPVVGGEALLERERKLLRELPPRLLSNLILEPVKDFVEHLFQIRLKQNVRLNSNWPSWTQSQILVIPST